MHLWKNNSRVIALFLITLVFSPYVYSETVRIKHRESGDLCLEYDSGKLRIGKSSLFPPYSALKEGPEKAHIINFLARSVRRAIYFTEGNSSKIKKDNFFKMLTSNTGKIIEIDISTIGFNPTNIAESIHTIRTGKILLRRIKTKPETEDYDGPLLSTDDEVLVDGRGLDGSGRLID